MRACVERDLKKVVALSTLSQLGLIFVCLGSLNKSYCFFHIISHACFKALLFICIGTSIHSVYGTQDYRRFNRLFAAKDLRTFTIVSSLSLLGFMYTSGCYRKEKILELLYLEGRISWCLLVFLLGIGLTTYYSFKVLACAFLIGSFSGIRSTTLGGFRRHVKRPMYLLGTMSLAFGAMIEEFTSHFQVLMDTWEKLLPLMLMISGFFGGYFLARYYSPTLSRLAFLTPISQQVSSCLLHLDFQKTSDKG